MGKKKQGFLNFVEMHAVSLMPVQRSNCYPTDVTQMAKEQVQNVTPHFHKVITQNKIPVNHLLNNPISTELLKLLKLCNLHSFQIGHVLEFQIIYYRCNY